MAPAHRKPDRRAGDEGSDTVNRGSLSAGERIELRRRRLGLSRRVVAQLVGRSEEWLRQVEQSHTQLDSIRLTYRLAEVLQLNDPMELVGWPSAERSPATIDLQFAPLRRVVLDHPSTRALTPEILKALPSPALLRASLQECRTIWVNSSHRYTDLAVRLPDVLVAARSIRAAAQAAPDGPVEEAGALLVDAYHLARFLLTHVGDHHLAAIVADRPIGIFARTAQPALVALSSWHVASAMLSLGYHAESRDYALAAARRFASESPSDRSDKALYGALQLIAAEGAAGAGDLTRSQDLIADARDIAEKFDRVPADRKVWFGNTEVAITEMNIALRLGKLDDVIELVAKVDISDIDPVDLRVRYYITAAYAYCLCGADFPAIFALQQAEQACPDDIRYDRMAHHTLQRLARRDHHLARKNLAKLLEVSGLA
ncbi:helix-turn-helix domain-containing protein [Nocardia sp. CA-128927]|uniref:helix-turn-helix domain-containing protein n=1 Tax=Nocardia sp. CA-128927 TaxID=3239975 RepID=UPI003D99EB33